MKDLLTEKIYVDENCEQLIAISSRQYSTIARLVAMAAIGALALQLLRLPQHIDKHYHHWINIFSYYLNPFLILAQVALNLMHYYYYYHAVKYQKKAILESDQTLFNKSFEFYKRGNAFSIPALLISIMVYLVFIYIEIIMK